MPGNAKYTSPEIQNELLSVMADMVSNVVVKRATDAGMFSIMADETWDKQKVEDLAIAVRYVHDGVPEGRLLSILKLKERDAKAITAKIMEDLEVKNLPKGYLVAQCHDGASVMSGVHNGVQVGISEAVGRLVPYVHCFAHQLHLVVVHATKTKEVAEFFDLTKELYEFFQRSKVTATYDGTTLKRLLEQRWSGHQEMVHSFLTNLEAIKKTLDTLVDCKETNLKIKALGIQLLVHNPVQEFVAKVLQAIFDILKPLNLQLQGTEAVIYHSIMLVKSTLKQLEQLLANGPSPFSPPPLTKRIKVTMSGYSFTRDVDRELSEESVKEIFEGILNPVLMEMRTRFSEQNCDLLQSLSSLLPGPRFLDFDALAPLIALADPFVKKGAGWKPELQCAKATFEMQEAEMPTTIQQIGQFFQPYEAAFPSVTVLYKTALTIGTSSATVERAFSSLTRILRPTRVSMTHDRKEDLVILSVHSDITTSLKLEDIIDCFAKKHPRRLALF